MTRTTAVWKTPQTTFSCNKNSIVLTLEDPGPTLEASMVTCSDIRHGKVSKYSNRTWSKPVSNIPNDVKEGSSYGISPGPFKNWVNWVSFCLCDLSFFTVSSLISVSITT